MARKNILTSTPPYPVEQALKRLGGNLREARLRRNMTIEEIAEKIGTGPRPVSDAEKGKASTSAAVYMALLWAYDLLDQMFEVADPAWDKEGLALSLSRKRARGKEKKGLDSDF
jgi:transcriptional regulator with XRE-family HTH domain